MILCVKEPLGVFCSITTKKKDNKFLLLLYKSTSSLFSNCSTIKILSFDDERR